MRMGRGLLAASLALSGCAAVDTPEACAVRTVAALPMAVARGMPVVEATIGGETARMLLDTGADATAVTPETFDRLKLRRDYGALSYSTGMGARGINWMTEKVGIGLGPVTLEPVPLLVVQFTGAVPFDGVIGGRELMGYDVDIDMPARQLRLHATRHCPSGAPFGPSTMVRAASSGLYRLSVGITVDGVALNPILDTGANGTVLDQDGLGLSDAALAGDRGRRMATADPVGLAVRAHRFKRLEIGDQVVSDPVLAVGRGVGAGLLGTDLWRTRRLWISYGSRTVTVGAPGR